MIILILKICATIFLCLASFAYFRLMQIGYYLTAGVYGFSWFDALLPTGASVLLLWWMWG